MFFINGWVVKRLPAVWLLPLLLLHQPVSAESVQPLAELLRRAEAHYADFHVEKFRHAANKEAAPIARAAFLPQVSASLQTERNTQDAQDWSANVSVEQIVYNLPEWRLQQAAQEQVALSDINLAVTRENLRRDVMIAWLDVQLAAEILRLIEIRRKTLREQLKRTETLAASGEVIEADVLFARAGLANANSQWEQAKHDLIVAHDAVTRYTNAGAASMQLASDIRLPPLPPVAQWQRRMEDNNLEIQAARQQAAYVRKRLQAAADTVYPRISLTGALNTQKSGKEIDDSWRLSLRQSLYTGGNLRAQQRQLVAESAMANEQIAAVQARHRQTIKRLHGQMHADLASIKALFEAADAADAFLQVVVIGYDNGVNIITDVLSAEEEVFDARLNLQQATYSYLKNLAAAHALLAASDDTFAAQIEQFFIPVTHN